MEESSNRYVVGAVTLFSLITSWILIHRWNQRHKKGPKTWPVIGAALEQLMNYDQMHDWLVKYLSESKTVVVPMPFTTYTYVADPVNVEHILRTNFSNYPKVNRTAFLCDLRNFLEIYRFFLLIMKMCLIWI